MGEQKRDLQADLKICNAATKNFKLEDGSEPRYFRNTMIVLTDTYEGWEEDTKFVEEARGGWPHAISRAIAAEAEITRFRELLRLSSECRKRSRHRAHVSEKEVAVLESLNNGLSIDCDELMAEVERLQAQRTEDVELMEETLEAQKLGLATIAKLRKALSLAHSMILGGERHTEQSKQVIESALGLR